MLILVPLAVGVVLAVTLRQTEGWPGRRVLLAVAGLALAVRLAAIVVIFLIARQAHDEGVWLNDEASFFLATESLMPNPLDRALPLGLGHLGGDGYLGLTSIV